MSQDLPFIWESSFDGMESLRISRVGQTVLARLVESQIWHQTAGSVALLREGSKKGQWPLPAFLYERKLAPSSCLDARHFSFFLYATMPFKLLTQCWSSEGGSPCVGSLRTTSWNSRSFFLSLNPYLFLQLEVMGIYFPGTGILA